MSCAFERLLSDYVDGELELRELARVRDHLDACAGCARAEAELRRLVVAVRALPQDREPPAEQWAQIAGQLQARPRWPWRRRISLAVGLCAAAAAGWLGYVRRVPPDHRSEQVLLEEARKQLKTVEEEYALHEQMLRAIAARDRAHWRPEVARAFEDSLRTIDEAIERYRAAAHRTGAHHEAMDNLLAAYRRRIDFLREAISEGAAGGSELDPL